MLLRSPQLWVLIIGALTPLAGYIINHKAAWTGEPVKAAVQVLLAAVAAGIYQALTVGHLGLNALTAQDVITAVGAALAAHGWLWKPAGINKLLGAGTPPPPPVSNAGAVVTPLPSRTPPKPAA